MTGENPRRLRPVPDPPTSENGGNGRGGPGGFEHRLTKLETHISYLSTRENVNEVERKIDDLNRKIETEVLKQRIWILTGVITGMVIAAGLAITIVKFFA